MPEKKSYVRNNLISSEVGTIYFGGYIHSSRGILQKQIRVLGRYALVYLISGAGLYENVNGLNLDVTAGDVIFVTPSLGHRYGPQINQTWEEIYFVFDGPLFDNLYRHKFFSESTPIGRLAPVHRWLPKIKAILEKIYVAEPYLTFSLLTEIQLLMTNAIAKEPICIPNEWSIQTEAYILKHLLETIDYALLAKNFNLGYENFRKLFKQEFGLPPKQYQLSLIMEKACKLMMDEDCSIKEIAQKVNFCNEFHFSKQFKKIIGVSPNEYKHFRNKV